MISSTHVLTTPHATRKSLTFSRQARSDALRGSRIAQPKLAITAGIIGFISLTAVILTHMGTYNVALTRMPAQQDVQVSNTTPVKQAGDRQSHQTTDAVNASQALVRINQADVNQYANQAEHDIWWASACSAASITMVINSYGNHVKITDILKFQAQIGAITSKSGLLYPGGIDQTAARFGFLTTTLKNPTLDQVIDSANKGKPVIVNFPPQTWAGGHFLVVRGGDSTTVRLADSSILNQGNGLQTVSRHYFLTYWRGLAKVLTPSPYVITTKPTVSVAAINTMLAAHHSPVSGQGQMISTIAVHYGLDPAYIVATFGNESTFGTKGEAVKSKSPGNLRCIKHARCENGYAQFDSWQQGFDALSNLLAGDLYVGDHRIIPETIIPRFAPNSDGNNEAHYIATVEHIIDVLRAGGSQI